MGSWEISWAGGIAVRGASPLRGRVVRRQATRRATRLPTPLHLQFTPHRGLAASPGSCGIIAGRRPEPREKWEERNACVVVDVRVARGRRSDGGTRGAVAGARRGGM